MVSHADENVTIVRGEGGQNSKAEAGEVAESISGKHYFPIIQRRLRGEIDRTLP